MDILTIIIIIILTIVILLLAGMSTTYSHDSMMTTANDARRRIRSERKSRYSIGMVILSNDTTGSDARWLHDRLAAYPRIRSEQDEADWERAWLPRMRAYLERIPQGAPSRKDADAFIDNEAALSDDRETLAATEAAISRMESSRLQMALLTAFTKMAEKTPALRKSMLDAKGRMKKATSSIGEQAQKVTSNMQDGMTGTPFHRYGDVRYFDDTDDAESDKPITGNGTASSASTPASEKRASGSGTGSYASCSSVKPSVPARSAPGGIHRGSARRSAGGWKE